MYLSENRITPVIPMIMAIVLAVSCANSEPVRSDSPEVANGNFRAVMTSVDTESRMSANFLRIARDLNPDAVLSERELIRLGAWHDEHRFEHSLRSLSGLIGRFYRETGRLPVDSQDVLKTFPVDALATHLQEGARMNLLGNLYDPITEQLYIDFQAQTWLPGAVHIEYIDDPKRAEEILLSQHPGIEFDSGLYERPTTALHMIVYGEAEGRILYDGWFY